MQDERTVESSDYMHMVDTWGEQPHDPSPYAPPGGTPGHGATGHDAPRYGATVDSPYASPVEIVEPPEYQRQLRQRRLGTPLLLYAATCFTTFMAYAQLGGINEGIEYAAAVMLVLTAHEMGHFLQALRYHVPASLPYFIPMPFNPMGTMGAVIGMRGHMGHRVALFDIGISGPLAGLVPALIFTIIGVHQSHLAPVPANLAGAVGMQFGDPLVIKFLVYLMKGPVPPGQDVILNPLLFAGWVGMLVTSLNLFPVGQLDGGHILYALLRRRSYLVSEMVLLGSVFAVVWWELWGWSLMLVLLVVMGPRHPPTANDDMPLGTGRTVLGILTLLFLFIGFTPNPFMM